MTVRPDPASFDLTLGRALGHAKGQSAHRAQTLPVPAGTIITLVRKIAVLVLLAGGFVMVPSIQANGLAESAKAVPSGPAMAGADLAARQEAALLISRP